MLVPTQDGLDFALGREASLSADVMTQSSGGGGGADMAAAMLGPLAGMLPPDAQKALSVGQPILTSALGSIMQGGGAGFNPASLLDAGSLMGMAGQFLPPQVAEALPMAQAVLSGNPMAMASALMGKFLPPELQAVASAMMQSGVMSSLADAVFPPPGSPGSADDASSAGPTSGVGPLAARIGDPHVCPAFDGPKPHVGGPVIKGMPTVLIGGPPAARIGDMATCAGPPDVISTGETTVLIGNQPAARMTDSTAHGGKIVAGCPTVMIGKKSGGQTAVTAKKCATSGHESGVAGTTA